MRVAYEDLGTDQFEELVVAICQFLLGIGVQGFATGTDGGRDARFIGTAELYPSKNDPWKGTVIAQAKHTNGFNKAFSDSDFYSAGASATVLAKEIPRIKKLRASGELDHYLLFSNRRLTGVAEEKLRNVIVAECDLTASSVALCGVEQIERWVKSFPQVLELASIDPVDSPLRVSSDDLAEVVEQLAEHMKGAPERPVLPVPRVTYELKNQLNNMSAEYAKELRKRYLKETQQVKTFLAAPENIELLNRYEAAAEEFQLQILAKRKNYQAFDEVINYLVNLLLERDPILRRHKKLTRTMVFYMYWNCDVGLSHDSST